MSERALRMLLSALAVLLAVWGITFLLTSRTAGEGRLAPLAITAFFGNASEANVSRVRLLGPRDTVTLEPSGPNGAWAANGFRADSAAVARFWAAFSEAGQGGEVVSTNPTNHSRLGVSSDSAWRVDVELDGGRRSMLVGKTGPRAHTAYVRPPESDTAYLVEGDLRIRVAYSTDDWRDRRIVAVDTAAVARISVELDGQRYALARSGAAWVLEGGRMTDSTTVRIMLTELRYLHAAGFLETSSPIARRPHSGAIVALTADGDTLASLTLGAGSGDRWARARGDSTLYRLAYYRVERVAPERARVAGDR